MKECQNQGAESKVYRIRTVKEADLIHPKL